MAIYAKFNENGRIECFWDEVVFPREEDGSVNPAIAADAITVTADQHKLIVEYQDKYLLVDGEIVEVDNGIPENP